MEDCSQHKKDLFGETDMKKVAIIIGDLHHKSLMELFYHLPNVFERLSEKDYYAGNNALGHNLNEIQLRLRQIQPFIKRLWEISKKFME